MGNEFEEEKVFLIQLVLNKHKDASFYLGNYVYFFSANSNDEQKSEQVSLFQSEFDRCRQ